MKNKNLKVAPKFKSEDEERAFWATANTTEYFDTENPVMLDLSKLNLQGHVHAQELYSALNIVRRCPPGPLLATLATQPAFVHVGDMHFRLEEPELWLPTARP